MSTMTWNPMTHTDYDTLKGYTVYTFDNEKVGTVKEILHPQEDFPTAHGRHFFRVEAGMLKRLFKDQDEFYLPERLIGNVIPNEEKIVLEIPKDRLKEQDWTRPREYDTLRRS